MAKDTNLNLACKLPGKNSTTPEKKFSKKGARPGSRDAVNFVALNANNSKVETFKLVFCKKNHLAEIWNLTSTF